MTTLSPWTREREHAAAPTPADADGYAPDAAPECWVRRSVGGALAFAVVLWHNPARGWLLRLGPREGFRLVEVERLRPIAGVRHIASAAEACVEADAFLGFYGYTLEPS